LGRVLSAATEPLTVLRTMLTTLVMMLVAPSAAWCAGPALFLVPKVFVSANRGEAAARAAGVLSSTGMTAYFTQRFKASYPDVTDAITDASSRRTFVVSLQISRVSDYEIPKVNGNVERQLAMTGSLYFTNIRTGEVLFTYTTTDYVDQTRGGATQERSAGDVALYSTLSRQLVDDLVTKSAAAFRPFEVNTTARRSYAGLVVLDRGDQAGVRLGDTLTAPDGSEANVVFTELGYSVGAPLIGKPETGVVWSKMSTRTLSNIHKADVNVQLAGNGSDLSGQELEQLFGDALAEKAPISIIPVNPDFAEVANYVRTNSTVSSQNTASRRMPQYFVRLTIGRPITYQLPTNIAYKTVRVANAKVYAELVDGAGRVQLAASGEASIRDEVTEGMGYAPAARAEVAIKNAIVDLAQNMASHISLERADLSIGSVGQGIFSTNDPRGLLRADWNLTVLRDLGRTDGIDSSVMVPSWTAHVTTAAAGQTNAAVDLAVFTGAPAVRPGDLARFEHVGATYGGAAYRACDAGEQLGSRKLAEFDEMALNLFSASNRGKTYFPEFVAETAASLRATGDFDGAVNRSPPRLDLCVEPVNKIDPITETCDSSGQCRTDVSLTVGYRIRRGTEIVKKAALQTTVHTTTYLKATAPADREALIDADVSAASTSLLRAVLQGTQLN